MNLLRTAIAIARLPFDLFTPEHRRPPRTARVIVTRGLGVHERDGLWRDTQGDLWRFNHAAQQWEYNCATYQDGDWISAMTGPSGYTSASYAPYRELLAEPLATTK